jgi:hypothetical protein
VKNRFQSLLSNACNLRRYIVGSRLFIYAYRANGPRPRVFARMQVIMAGLCKANALQLTHTLESAPGGFNP